MTNIMWTILLCVVIGLCAIILVFVIFTMVDLMINLEIGKIIADKIKKRFRGDDE